MCVRTSLPDDKIPSRAPMLESDDERELMSRILTLTFPETEQLDILRVRLPAMKH
jgi:hypothetical protein